MNRSLRWAVAAAIAIASARAAWADAVLVMEDPINFAGRMTSSGHAAVWLDRVCSDDHVSVRGCRAGEAGTVLSRYEAVPGKVDWLAVPPNAYFFSVDQASAIPASVSKEGAEMLRMEYRAEHQHSFQRDPGDAVWTALLGESYRRRVVLVRVRTTAAQDAGLVAWLNGRGNVSHFNMFSSNCGDFVGLVLGHLFPGAIHRQYLLDAGIMTPKQLEAKLHRYALRHPELGWEATVIPQVPGEIPRSRHLYGVTESYLKTYPYLLPLDYLLPFELGFVTGLGVCDHRYVAKPVERADVGAFFGSEARGAQGGQ